MKPSALALFEKRFKIATELICGVKLKTCAHEYSCVVDDLSRQSLYHQESIQVFDET